MILVLGSATAWVGFEYWFIRHEQIGLSQFQLILIFSIGWIGAVTMGLLIRYFVGRYLREEEDEH